jgi:predicted HicB family RNase H-like nuclease
VARLVAAKTNLRTSPELKEKLKAAAMLNRRSLNQEICIRLERSFGDQYRR